MRTRENCNNEDKKKSLEDYEHCIGSNKQASDFEVATKFIINYIQENFESSKHVTEALRKMNSLSTDKWRTATSVNTE